MYFLVGGRGPFNAGAPPIHFHGDSVEQAVRVSERVATDLPPGDPAVAFCVIDPETNRIVHQGLCGKTGK
jgi:hypothetical protein